MNPKLLEAARSGDKTILDELLEQDFFCGASMGEIAITVSEDAAIQQDTSCLLGVTPDGNTALHIVATRGHLELAKEIYHKKRSLLVAPNMRCDTPLHCAARAGNDKMVSLIIEFVKQDGFEATRVLQATNNNKDNALHEAARYDHMHVAKILMEEDAELASMLNNGGMSPFYLAIAMGSLNVAKVFLQSSFWEKASSAYYAGPRGETVLHRAIFISQEITEEILIRKPNIAKDADWLGRIPLHDVAQYGHQDTAKLLLKHDPSTAYLSDADGFFPIHIAAMSGNFPVADEILKRCPYTDELSDKRGRNFLHAAFQKGNLNVVKKIISKRPDLKKLLNERDNMGDTPLHTAVRNSDQECVNFLMRDKTLHINAINNDNCTPLDLAFQALDPGMSDKTNAASCILSCLAFARALPGPPGGAVLSSNEGKRKSSSVGEVKEESPSDEVKKKPFGNDKVKEDSSPEVEGEMGKWLLEEIKKRQDEEIKKELEESPSDEIKKKPFGNDKAKENPSPDGKWLLEEIKKRQDEEIKKELDVPKNSVIATVLIATVTFAAGFTLPGGYIADDHPGRGTAVLSKEYAFKVFLVSDAFAFIFSILATFWFMDAGSPTVDRYTRSRAHFFALWCLWLAFSGMFTAFAMGIYATLAHSYRTIGILLCIIVLSTPILANIGSRYNLYSFRKTVGIRQGYRHWIWPTTLYPHVETIFHSVLISRGAIIFFLLPVLGSYATFFLLPMLFGSKI